MIFRLKEKGGKKLNYLTQSPVEALSINCTTVQHVLLCVPGAGDALGWRAKPENDTQVG